MSRGAVCPALRKEGEVYICNFTGKPVNPYAWYCFFDYITCPIYIRHRGTSTVVEAKPETGPQLTEARAETEEKGEVSEEARETVTPSPVEISVRPSGEYEDMIMDDLKRIIEDFEHRVSELDRKWKEYEDAVNTVRALFDKERILVEHHLELLKRVISMYELDLKELDYRKDLGILDDEQYSKLREEIENRLARLRREYEELIRRFDYVTNGVLSHVKKLLTVVPTPEVGKLRVVLMKLDELLRDGKISREVYDRLKRELESLLS
ncbi:MAG: hypothetical protein GXO23_01125 [Crenarchaeota archaeon]|nr:hypothetical protein [Thermoproteota archaeon]